MLRRGEVWLFDCGMVEKVRPVLILSVPHADRDRVVVTVVFQSTRNAETHHHHPNSVS